MSKLKLIYRNELRLLYRNPFLILPFVVLLLCWGYVIFSYESQPVHYEELAAEFYNNFQWIMLISLLLAGLLSVYMAGKDHESEFEHVVVTYKVKNTEWVAGKWLVAQTYGLCLTIMTLLIQGIWFFNASISTDEWIRNLAYVCVQMEGAFFFIISCGFLFAALIRNMIAYICIPALLGIAFLAQANSYGFALVNPRFNLLTPYDSMYMESPYDSIWGINGVFDEAVLHQLIVLLLGVIVLFAAILLFRPHRSLRIEKRMLMTLIIILMIPAILVGGIRYQQYDRALEQFMDTGQRYMSKGANGESLFYTMPEDRPKYPFAMERTQLNVYFPSENWIKVDSQLTIAYNGDVPINDVSLTLHHQLAVTGCSSHQKLSCSRDNDGIRIHFHDAIEPNERIDLKLDYEGDIGQYRLDGLLQHAFVESDRIYLPKEAGWYPLIGDRRLVESVDARDSRYVQFEVRNGALAEDYPTEFAVTIMGQEIDIPMALTIPRAPDGSYKGATQYGLSLIGGNLEEASVGQTRIVGHPEVLDGAKKTTELYQESWSYMEEWLGVPVTPKVIYIMDSDYQDLTQFTPSREFYAWSVYDIGYVDASFMPYRLVANLINENRSYGDDVSVLQRAMIWVLLDHSGIETGSDQFGDWYAAEGRYATHEQKPKGADQLSHYEEVGKEQFREAVKYLFLHYEGLEDKAEFNLEAALAAYEGADSQ